MEETVPQRCENAMIFDIQRASYVDGPGLRTTVFLKGCNLRCRWCHNPESQDGRPVLLRYPARCTHCGVCASHCPEHAISADGATNPALCIACGKCALYCLNDARKLCGRPMSAQDVLAAVLPDRPYYDATGGGVTVSGGECMLHIDFLEAFLRLCHENGLRTAVDTAGNVPFSAFERIIPHADLFLYDVKCIAEETHIAGTGVSNRLILDNLARLLKTRADSIVIRVPVIPGFNDNEEEIGKIAAFFRAHGRPARIELLPYHRLGENKNAVLGREGFTAEPPSKELMARLNALLDDLR